VSLANKVGKAMKPTEWELELFHPLANFAPFGSHWQNEKVPVRVNTSLLKFKKLN